MIGLLRIQASTGLVVLVLILPHSCVPNSENHKSGMHTIYCPVDYYFLVTKGSDIRRFIEILYPKRVNEEAYF